MMIKLALCKHRVKTSIMNEKSIDILPEDIDRIIEMAWEDRTPFEAIQAQFGINESAVIVLMRKNMSDKAFTRWRKRVSSRKTKHEKIRNSKVSRHQSSCQRKIHRP